MSDFLLLPSEIFIEILIRLPVKILLRCTSVCKSWYSLVTSPYFITTHLKHNNNNANNQILLRSFFGDNCYLGIDHYSVYRDNDTFDKLADLDVPFSCIDGCFRVIGCSNGLIFFSDDEFGYKQTMYLWNPSIRKFVTVPRPRVTFDSKRSFDHAVGFGFDAAANDYKIVRLVYVKSNNIKVPPPEVELFELSTGSWRSINAGDFKYVAENQTPHAFLNGVIHWTGYEKGDLPKLIVSFDLQNEELGAIMLPPEVPGITPSSYLRVATFRDTLSLIQRSIHIDYYYCIWVMKDYGVAKSWTKEFAIDVKGLSKDAIGFFSAPFGFRDNGDALLSLKSSQYEYAIQDLVSYDPESKQIKYLGIHGHPCLFYKDSYVESLVLVKGLSEVLGRKKISCDAVACMEAFISPKEDDDNDEGGRESV
ncbi:hypothetical protein LguiA_022101 [Lonicera macranthoides]